MLYTIMKAISMAQPYAWLFSRGYLRIDDRRWRTNHRGPVLIHASKSFDLAYYEWVKRSTNWPLPEIQDFQHGGVIAVAQITGCLRPSAAGGIERSHMGAPGHFGIVISTPIPMSFIPARGKPMIFELPDEILSPPELPPSESQPRSLPVYA
jgi:hypothetical protein